MMEIRPVRESEAEAFLQVLTEVFGLDFKRAQNVFFSEPMYDLSRKWALLEDGEIVSVLTTTPLTFGWGRAVGIAGVATRASHRRAGRAAKLVRHVLQHSQETGEGPALLFARDQSLYLRLGFEPLDRVISAPLITSPPHEDSRPMSSEEVRELYDRWAAADPNRLRRDDRRWQYWNWHCRVCESWAGGYILHEPSMLREALYRRDAGGPPVPAGTQWYGLTRMADVLGYQFESAREELFLMGHQYPRIPEMFMTDQF